MPDANPHTSFITFGRIRPLHTNAVIFASQYTSHACRQRIEDAGALAGYARPGNPYDNVQAEAGWSTLKTELLPHGGAFASLEEARPG